MAGAFAQARAAQKAAAILTTARAHPSRDCDGALAGRTHARNPVPRLRFTAYILATQRFHATLPLLSQKHTFA
jgi:hypothetical protein